jgi:hypothetical protein
VPRSGLTRKTPEYVRSHCSRGSGLLLGSLNVDRAVGFHDDVFQPVEAPALEAVGNNCDATVRLLAGDAARVVLAVQQPALPVAGEAVGTIGRLCEDRRALTRRVPPVPVASSWMGSDVEPRCTPLAGRAGPFG